MDVAANGCNVLNCLIVEVENVEVESFLSGKWKVFEWKVSKRKVSKWKVESWKWKVILNFLNNFEQFLLKTKQPITTSPSPITQ